MEHRRYFVVVVLLVLVEVEVAVGVEVEGVAVEVVVEEVGEEEVVVVEEELHIQLKRTKLFFITHACLIQKIINIINNMQTYIIYIYTVKTACILRSYTMNIFI